MPTIHSEADEAALVFRRYWPSSRSIAFQRKADSKDLSLVFTAAWPFSGKMYDHLIIQLCESYGYPCILIDRRGFGKSHWTGDRQVEIEYDTFASDLCQILRHCNISHFVGIGASLGCGELLMALSKDKVLHDNCEGLIFLGPSLPIPMQTARKEAGPPREFWDELLRGLREDCWDRIAKALPYIWGEKGSEMLSSAEHKRYEAMAFEADPMALERTVQIFLQNDFTDFLEQKGSGYNFPVLILHGGADAANPVEAGPGFVQKCLPKVEVKVYDDAAHGIAATHKQKCLEDIISFLSKV